MNPMEPLPDSTSSLASPMPPPLPPPSPLAKALLNDRRAIAAELLLFLVLALLPLPVTVCVPLLVGLAMASLGIRNVEWKEIGWGRPQRLWAVVAGGATIATAIQLLDHFAIGPWISHWCGHGADLDAFSPVRGHIGPLLLGLLVSWTVAAFGEEMVFRAYFLSRCKDLMGSGWLSNTAGVIIAAIPFAASHRYQGMAGMLNAGWIGLILGTLYVAGRRRIALPSAVHGFVDTIGFVALYLGVRG